MAAEDIEQPPAPAMNDPWAPQPPSNVTVMPCPVDPIHQLISSDKYIESLEKKLNRLKGRAPREPTARDIVQSLSKLRNDQMERFLKEESCQTQAVHLASGGEAASASYIQRRLYPEKQAVTGDEVVELLQADALANRIAEEQELEELAAGNATAAMVISKTGETTDSASEPVCMATDVAEVQILSSPRKEDLAGASNVDSEQENSENKT
ncbi:coiled-coil domain-containing protein 32-like [Haliotis cracherodii]|uniref:coiled-coil domain-containing protein 32-like n=1 Tax=Haliotis cracherodii TaxID=6455 RepID=UPI0039EB345C